MPLFQPLTIRGLEIPNRVWVSPMCQYSAEDGFITQWHRIHYGALATGGSGLIFVEATGVVPEGRISTACLGIWDDDRATAFRPIVQFAHAMGRKIGIQLAHAGRKGSVLEPAEKMIIADSAQGGWQTVSSGPEPFFGMQIPHQLSLLEIEQVQDRFAEAASRAVSVGFDVIEIHAAHGYLIHQFFSPLANHRRDGYGGSFDGRTRFLREIVTKVRNTIPEEMPLFVRISATDWITGGWDIEQSVALSVQLKELGVDLIDVSSGGIVHNAVIPVAPGYQVPLARQIREHAKILTAAVGLITEPEQAAEIISSNKADAVLLARAMLRNPRWTLTAADALGVAIDWPRQLRRGSRPKS